MLAVCLTLALCAPQGGAPVVINEFSYDDSSTDDREFVELYNATGSPIDIGDWVLASDDENGANTGYTIPTGTMLAANDYYVMGSAIVPNVDQVVGTTNLWENSQESLMLQDNGGRLVDSVVYEANKGLWSGSTEEGEGIWANFTSIDGLETSWSRAQDGLDTDNNGNDFVMQPQSPGTSNAPGGPVPYYDNFDAAAAEATLTEWGSSFAEAHVIDPTAASASNPNAISASPQGGNAAIFWDSSGGGNANMLASGLADRAVLEGYFYFDATPEAAGEYETWSVGFGSTGTFYNTPDPSGALGSTANGNTGMTWTFQNTEAGGTLYLIDHNDGAWGSAAKSAPSIIAAIPVIPGVDDGWQRLRLDYDTQSGTALANFGGTLGCTTDGVRIFCACSGAKAFRAYVGYREFVGDNATTRPLTMDGITVRGTASSGSTSETGVAIATNSGTPTWGSMAAPTVGVTMNFSLSGLVPSSMTFVMVGTLSATPFDLSTIGGQSGSMLLVDILAVVPVMTDGSGNAAFSSPGVCDAALVNTSIYWQDFDVDLSLAFSLPVGNSTALETKMGI